MSAEVATPGSSPSMSDKKDCSNSHNTSSTANTTSTSSTTKNQEQETQHAMTKQVAELAAAAGHQKSLDENQILSSSSSKSSKQAGLTSSPTRSQLMRRRSSGVPRASSSGLRAMSQSLVKRSDGSSQRMPGLGRTASMTPRSRGVYRAASSDMSPMLTASGRSSFSRNHAKTTLLRSEGSSGNVEPVRGVRRAQSSLATVGSRARLAPDRRGVTKSDSSRNVPSRRGVGRTCSQNSLAHMANNGAGASTADVGTLRPYRGREGLVNMSIQRSDSLRRSVDDRSVGDMSNFTMATMDSVNLRKQQIVADPIDDAATYRDADSYADHESVSMATNDYCADFQEFLPEVPANHVPYDGVSVADTLGSMDELGGRVLDSTRLLLDADTNHSRPNHIACDAVSLSTIGGDIEEIDELESYLGEEEYEATLREEIEAFEEGDEDDESTMLDRVKEEEKSNE